MKAEEIQI
jgi:hypothetical protein